MTLLALLRLLVIRECVFVKRDKRERYREGENEMEREKGRMCRWLLSQGGFFSSSKLELQQRGFVGECGLPRFTKKENPNA